MTVTERALPAVAGRARLIRVAVIAVACTLAWSGAGAETIKIGVTKLAILAKYLHQPVALIAKQQGAPERERTRHVSSWMTFLGGPRERDDETR